MPEVSTYRKAAVEIDPIYTERWSPRSFEKKEVPQEALDRIFEAARWAPSAGNEQPWRFVMAKTAEDRERFLSFIYPGNTIWCSKAPVLIAILSKKEASFLNGGHNHTHAFDAGAAWGYLALEAARQGLAAHAMGGFDKEKAREVLGVPDNYDIHAMVAVGYRGSEETLPEALKEREKPSGRHDTSSFLTEGTFREKL